ncbi:MAG: glycosyltransferase [Kiritimatiellaeota bacterium]|nr:glycosyltransferase [Kiritimatiellota bacterium]
MSESVHASLVMLAHNGHAFTRTCLESLLRAGDMPGEFFLIDNGSTDATPDLIAEFAPRFEDAGVRFVTWRNEQNKGCSQARNEAWERAAGRYVVFMDNDTAACTRNWLSLLAKSLDDAPEAALAGPKLIYPFRPHPIQCAGVSFNRLGRVAFRGRGRPRHTPQFSFRRSVPALISACWIMRNDLRHTIGMLDRLFHPVQYEDLDLCLRARRAGFDVLYNPTVEMYHFEGITTAAVGATEYRRNIARNSARFRERWHEVFPVFEDDLAPGDYRWISRRELGLRPELDLTLCDPASDATPETGGTKKDP